jgi:hypothetical protein
LGRSSYWLEILLSNARAADGTEPKAPSAAKPKLEMRVSLLDDNDIEECLSLDTDGDDDDEGT